MYGYDFFGNWRVVADRGNGMPLNVPQSLDGNNRIASAGDGYDSRGNLRLEAGGDRYLYDVANRMVLACRNLALCAEPAGVPETGKTVYRYDTAGRRVAKVNGGGTTTFVYDADGQLAAEYGGMPTRGGTLFLTSVHFGSTRVATDAAAADVWRMNYTPFGMIRWFSGTEPRAGMSVYGASPPMAQQFTSKKRDGETGLDYFGARYIASSQGRFTSPDKPLFDQDESDPQSWNLYSSVRNNPLIFYDPTGNDCVHVNSSGTGLASITNENPSQQCEKAGGFWVDGTVTDARFAHGSLILTGTHGENRTSASYGLGPDAGLLAPQRGTQLAEPGVNLAAQGLMVFGSIVAPLPMALAQCGAGDCSITGIAMAMLPEIAAL